MRTDNERDTEVVDLTARDPIDGDDITVVVPSAEPARTRQRGRTFAIVGLGLVSAVAVVALAVAATRHHGSKQRFSVSATPTTEASATGDTARSNLIPAPSPPTSSAAASPTTRSRPNAQPQVVVPQSTAPANRSVLPPPQASTPPTARTPATVKMSPPSVLQWSASPASLQVPAGGSTFVTVTVRNPSDGVVTLPVPLSCTPKLDGSGVCPEVAQLIQPHSQEAVRYSVDATNVAPGSYRLVIENGLFSITVSVTP